MDRKTLERNKRRDNQARLVITLGGISTLVCVIGMLVMLVQVTLPLFFGSHQAKLTQFHLPQSDNKTPVALGIGEYISHGFWLDDQGRVHVLDLTQSLEIAVDPLPGFGNSKIVAVQPQGKGAYSLLLADGSARLDKIEFYPSYEGDNHSKVIRYRITNIVTLAPSRFAEPPRQIAAAQGEDTTLFAALLPSNRVQIIKEGGGDADNELMLEIGLEADTAPTTFFVEAQTPLSQILIDQQGTQLFGVSKTHILRWKLEADSATLQDDLAAFADNRQITSIAMAWGDQSLVVGDSLGAMHSFSLVNDPSRGKHLQETHQLQTHADPITQIQTSYRHKSLLSQDAGGWVFLDHLTSENQLLRFNAPAGISQFAFSLRGDALLALDKNRELHLWEVDTPHPETNFTTIFSKVWYENYDEPAYVWQSSAGNDDFETKLSLVPLIFGSIKGCLYAMIFALPIGIFGAVYTNEFASRRFREIVKPAVEITAAVPSVIIGFVAALWLAPLVDQHLLGFFFYLTLLPLAFGLFLFAWSRLRADRRYQRFERSKELFLVLPLLLLCLWLALALEPALEAWFFDGSFKRWVYDHISEQYDQRNSIIISFALGFTVIPFIFTMTDDALSSVPTSLKAASQALGASRWQTLWTVLLPSASPGLFAGVILGMGRAIGETMIVLMATGNTPIIDPSMFNGMRTLSANIAVEMPEAPVDGTLYRVLFLSAVILFGFTFLLNSLAEVVRNILRKRYAQF